MPGPKHQAAPATLPPEVRRLLDGAIESIGVGLSERSVKSYSHWWNRYLDFCYQSGVPSQALTPDVLVAWLQLLRKRHGRASILVALAAATWSFGVARVAAPRSHPLVRDFVADLRQRDSKPAKRARALTPYDLIAMVQASRDSVTGPRDAALLLFGFVTGMRESELVGIQREDLVAVGLEWHVLIRRSKTHRTGAPEIAGIPRLADSSICPALALREYLEWSGVWDGPLFRSCWCNGRIKDLALSVRDVDRILLRAAARAGISQDGLSGHSLRRGLATAAAAAGVDTRVIAHYLRQKDIATTTRYVEEQDLLRNHPARRIGLG